jgi:two-component system, LytTR family, response regulator
MVSKIQFKLIAITALLCIVAITLLQDFLHARFNQYTFYFSESVLFKSFWVLFFPLAWLQLALAKKYRRMSPLLVILSTAVHFMLFALLVAVLSTVFLGHTFAVWQTIRFSFSEDLLTCLLVYSAIAILSWYSNRQVLPVQDAAPVQNSPVERIVIGAGRNNISIATSEIILISAANDYIAIQTASKKYLHTETLKSIQAKLDAHRFLRIHKSAIINLDNVVSYRSRLNGDYDILLSNQQETRLSRNYAPAFKAMMEKQTQHSR